MLHEDRSVLCSVKDLNVGGVGAGGVDTEGCFGVALGGASWGEGAD